LRDITSREGQIGEMVVLVLRAGFGRVVGEADRPWITMLIRIDSMGKVIRRRWPGPGLTCREIMMVVVVAVDVGHVEGRELVVVLLLLMMSRRED
jgi:hypothetical protein